MKAGGYLRLDVGMQAHAVGGIVFIVRQLGIGGQLTILIEQQRLRFEQHIVGFDRLPLAQRSRVLVHDEFEAVRVDLGVKVASGQPVTFGLIVKVYSSKMTINHLLDQQVTTRRFPYLLLVSLW